MKTVTKLAALTLALAITTPAFATVTIDSDKTQTNPIVNQKDTIKADTSPHANAPGSIQPKPVVPMHPMGKPGMMKPGMMMQQSGDALTQEQRDEIAKRRAMRQDKMKSMTPAEREAARQKWDAKRAEWEKMTPAQREAAKAKWDARMKDKGEHKDLNKESRQTNINEGVGAVNSDQ